MNEPYVDHQAIALTFANALSFFLEEDQGIVARGKTADKQMHKFLVWKHEGKVHTSLGDEVTHDVGTSFHIYDTLDDTILEAALNGGEFVIEE